MKNPRSLALSSLVKSTEKGKYTNLELGATLDKESLSPEDRALYTRLYLGVIEKKITLDYLLSRISTIPLNTLEIRVLCLLELGAYQILYLDGIPDHAAVNESVMLAKRENPGCVSFINAVLRKLAGEKEEILSYLNLPGKKGLSLRYGYPRWLITLWQEAYGKEKCVEILEAQNTPARLTIRVNTTKISLSEYKKKLEEEKIPFHENKLCKNSLTIEKNLSPTALFGFSEGLFFVQDAAAGHAVDKLDVKPFDRVLDLCASPGGKSFAAGIQMENKGEVLSLELYESRVPLIKEGALRLGLSCIKAQQNDSSKKREEWKDSFDKVICDVPCSGYGTIAKKPEIRHKDPEEAKGLPEIQLAILEAGAYALKPGGKLVYSTCTLNPEENENVTSAFLSRHPEFRRVGEYETIFPKGGEHDGFFCDLMEKLV